jgi:segregation and condensation protein B
MDRFELMRLLEAVLFGSDAPLSLRELGERMPEGADVVGLLNELQEQYANRGVHLAEIGDRWAFRTAPDLGPHLGLKRTVQRKMSRAALEVLAIVAYHQPVTRAEIEEIRGVATSRGTLDTLLEIGWIRPRGRRRTPGRPVTWGVSDSFLDHFGLEGTDALPGIAELKAAGLLERRPGLGLLSSFADEEEDGDLEIDTDEDDGEDPYDAVEPDDAIPLED